MKKKILFVAPNLHHGGAEAVLIKILNNIDLNLFDVRLVLLKKEGGHLSKLRKEVKLIDLDCKGAFKSIGSLKRVIYNEDPDIVFSIIGHINLMLSGLKLLFFRKTTFIGRENIVYNEWLYKDKTLKKRILSIGYKTLLKRLDHIVVQSNFMEKQVREYFNVGSSKISVLNNPIEQQTIEKLSDEQELGNNWNHDKINLIAVGRLEVVKNYLSMIDIVELLPKKFHLNILGDGREREALHRYIISKGLENSVTLHGYVDNPYKYMKNSFALLLTSTRESFPNVVLEANECGTYAFSYNMPGGVSEIIEEDVNGNLIAIGNKEDFANKIIEVLERGYNANTIIERNKKYSINQYMDAVYNIFGI